MAEKDANHINISNVISKIKEKVALSSIETDDTYIPDIIEFCYSKKYLNMKAVGKVGVKPITLFPMQQIILKSFYRGQTGNEHIKLTPEEIELLFTNKMQLVLDKYHSDALFRELVLVLGRRCVSEDTQLTLSNGDKIPIGQLWDNKKHKIKVLSLDERDYKLKHSNAEIIHNGEQNVYRIELRDGRFVEATDNHPFLTVRGWTNVSDLIVGDCVAVPACIKSSPDIDITKHEARLLGYMIGDGCCSSANPFFTCANKDILNDFQSCLYKLSNNIVLKKDKWSSAESRDIQYKITKARPEYETFESNGREKTRPQKNKLQKLLDDNGLSGKTSHSKFVPSSVLRSSNECVAEFLRAIYSCDGSIYNKWSARDSCYKVSISYSSVSEQLARDIAHLLLRFGINPRLRIRKIKSNCTSYEINIDSYEDVNSFLKSIGFIGKSSTIPESVEDKRAFWMIPKCTWEYIDSLKKEQKISTDRELLGEKSYSNERCRRNSCISRKQISKINMQLQDEHLNKIVSSSVLWMPVKSISFVGKKRTFDVSVSDSYRHNFVANDIILHNSGKDFMTSMIALYECMKLLECPGGSPFGYYGIAPGNPIYIITVATSADQARILYNEIKQRMQASEYFKNKIGKVEADRLWFLTPEDKKNNAELVKQGMGSAQTPGSVCIMSGHSNSEGLLGKRIYCLLLDEVASFKTTGGATSGDRIYSALTPATADFRHPYKTYKDENEEDVPLLDSKIVSISSPRGEEGMLFHLYSTASGNPNRIAFKLPTWKVNGMFSEASLRTEFKFMNPNEFMMEFGAEFSGTAGEKFIPDLYVDQATEIGRNLGLTQRPAGIPGMIYYAHLDPAATSHNYALVVLHVEERIRVKETDMGIPKKEKFKMFVVDHIKVWHPQPERSVKVHEVDEYIIDLARRFRFGMVSYDSWNSLASIQKLRAKGIPTRMTQFRKKYKIQIYDHLEDLLVNNQIALPYKGSDAELLEMELKCLKRIYGPQGFKIKPDEDALVTTDDCCDALAGACGQAMDQQYAGYAKGGVVNLPQSRSMALGQSWNIGRGQYAPQQWQFLNRKFGKFG